jgi:hypothetical protein
MSADEKRLGMAGWSLLMGLKWFVHPSCYGGTSFDIRAFGLLCLLIQRDSWHEGLCIFMPADVYRLGMASLSLRMGLKWFVHSSHRGGTPFDVRAFAPSCSLIQQDIWPELMRAVFSCLLARRNLVWLVGLGHEIMKG